MSQFNKYLEIVQEGKDYQYNEGLFSFFSKKTKTDTQKIFEKIYKENTAQPGVFVPDPNSEPEQEIEIEKEIKKIQTNYLVNSEVIAVAIGFLTIGFIVTKYGNKRYYMNYDKNKSQEILQLIEKDKKYVRHIIKIDGTGTKISYDLKTYKESYEAEQAEKKKAEEDYDHVPR